MHTTFTVAFSPAFQVWFSCRAEGPHVGEFASIEAAQQKASELNGLLVTATAGAAAHVIATVPVTWTQIEDQLCAAWEGGSSYWLECYGAQPPTDPADAAKVEYRYQNALYPGGACLVRLSEGVTDEDMKLPPLTREKLLTGVQVMATKYPKHFANLRNDDGDAETGDVFVQCCLLGEVVYG